MELLEAVDERGHVVQLIQAERAQLEGGHAGSLPSTDGTDQRISRAGCQTRRREPVPPPRAREPRGHSRPVGGADRVLSAMHRAMPNIYGGELIDVSNEVIERLPAVARTAARPFVAIANGHGAWEMALSNTLSRR